MHKIMSQSRVHSLRVLFGLPLLLIDPNELFAFTSVFAKTIVGDPIKPGVKFCFTTKAPDVLVSAKERVLRQIVGQRDVAPSELAQQFQALQQQMGELSRRERAIAEGLVATTPTISVLRPRRSRVAITPQMPEPMPIGT